MGENYSILITGRMNPSGVSVLLRGIIEYAQEVGRWSFQVRTLWDDEVAPAVRRLRPDGLIVGAMDPIHARRVVRTRCPAVSLHSDERHSLIPAIDLDNSMVGCRGAEHLLSRGFRHLAYCGVYRRWSREREREFCRTVTAAGADCHVLARPDPTDGDARYDFFDFEPPSTTLRHWLRPLPKPLGVMCANDMIALQVVDACERLGLRVPHDVAVLGVDNTELRCEFSGVQLSSVDAGTQRMGHAAAALLHRLMRGEPAPRQSIVIQPGGVVARRSTERLAFDDPDVNAAIEYMHGALEDGIDVEDVVRRVQVSRSALERRFKQAVGRTPGAYLRRLRLDRAASLLRDTDLPLVDIAARTGFRYIAHLSTAFKLAHGDPPKAYRAAHRRKSTR